MKILFISFLTFLVIFGQINFAKSQTNWVKDISNPVLRRDTVISNFPNDLIAISDCWVLKEGATYKMWYTCGGINYPADTELRSRLCYATSNDGQNWTKYAGNPVLDVSYSGAWDSLGVETASVIIDPLAPTNERYKMWYAGQYYNSYRYDIGYAFSSDGINWIKHLTPVLQVGLSSAWDNGFLEGPSVIKDGGIYKMWYCGYDAVVNGNSTDGKANIGYATSIDGINWTKYAGNPILTTVAASWESTNVQDPHVIKEGSQYYMWYGGGISDSTYDQQVGFATSNDGINWTKAPQNPVLTRGNMGDWDSNLSSFPSVLNDNGIYKMWYTGRDEELTTSSLDYYWEIGYATDISAGMKLISMQTDIHLYPNPTKNTVTISSDTFIEEAIITIYNSIGLIVQNHSVTFLKEFQLSLDNLANGVYLIEISGPDTKLTKRLIIVE